MIGFLFFLFIPFTLLYGTWAWAVVIKSTWLWFIVTAFNQPPLTFAQAVAMSVIFSTFAIRVTPTKEAQKTLAGKDDWKPYFHIMTMVIFLPWVVWCINWIIKSIFI